MHPIFHANGLPQAQGLYDSRHEHDACGVGFVAQMHNKKSHDIVAKGLEILLNLDHRGAVGADAKAGDGCGMLIQIPDRFLREEMAAAGVSLPPVGHYAVGALFLPRDAEGRKIVEDIVEKAIADEGQVFLGWRNVPVDSSGLGESVKPTEPGHAQYFVGKSKADQEQDEFERRLYIVRKVISARVYALRDVRKQYQRNREQFGEPTDAMPVYGTIAARFNDDGVTALYQALLPKLFGKGLKASASQLPVPSIASAPSNTRLPLVGSALKPSAMNVFTNQALWLMPPSSSVR